MSATFGNMSAFECSACDVCQDDETHVGWKVKVSKAKKRSQKKKSDRRKKAEMQGHKKCTAIKENQEDRDSGIR